MPCSPTWALSCECKGGTSRADGRSRACSYKEEAELNVACPHDLTHPKLPPKALSLKAVVWGSGL